MRIFSGNSNLPLSEEICSILGGCLGKANVKTFSDGEIQVDIDESVRGMDVFVIQSTSTPVNNNLMELLIMMDALKRASANRITAVLPYYGYARQDRKVSPRAPITAKLVADLITTAGANRVLAIDLHAGQIQGFFNIPVDHLFAAPVLLDYLSRVEGEKVIVSPDAGGVERARAFAKRMKAGLAIIDKRRQAHNVAEVMNVIGDVAGKTAILVDDMIDTAGTICEGARLLRKEGASRVYACATHAVFSPPAIERLSAGLFEEVIITNTIPVPEEKQFEQLTVLSVANLLGETIWRIHEDSSVSSMFR